MTERTALIDTNLLVLLSVGLSDRTYVARHKRTAQFLVEDFDLLVNVLSSYNRVVVTPNVLSESSNLCAYIAEPAKAQVMNTLKALIERHQELYVESTAAAGHTAYLRLGLTDASIHLAADDATVLTTDFDLYQSLLAAGKNVVNFNHVREWGWQGAG
ncbi:PIN domain-containing protein [Xanthomonas campestris]|uniref:PIN domain-containing protein n=1 Tax=Xanthomonas campestris TaxID=339 RepID=UPI00388D1D0A